MRRQLRPAIAALLIFTVLTGLIYPLFETVIAQAIFPGQANGSLVRVDGRIVGSNLLGQDFASPKYFWGRPSATDPDTGLSGGSNYGPTNPTFLKLVGQRVVAYRKNNLLGNKTLVPVDAVTASGSGLDPDISIANAMDQAVRVAEARSMSVTEVENLINKEASPSYLGFLGTPMVNVLQLNIALNKLSS